MATRKTRRPKPAPTPASPLTFTVANLGAEAQLVGGRARAAVANAERRLAALRRHAAQSALDWVLAHDRRVAQFRRWSQGTRAGHALEAVLDELRIVAEAPPAMAIRSVRTRQAGKSPTRNAPATRSTTAPGIATRKPARRCR